jgi:hypothetical protein
VRPTFLWLGRASAEAVGQNGNYASSIRGPESYLLVLATFRRKMIDFDQANRPLEINYSCLCIGFLPTSHLSCEAGQVSLYAFCAARWWPI